MPYGSLEISLSGPAISSSFPRGRVKSPSNPSFLSLDRSTSLTVPGILVFFCYIGDGSAKGHQFISTNYFRSHAIPVKNRPVSWHLPLLSMPFKSPTWPFRSMVEGSVGRQTGPMVSRAYQTHTYYGGGPLHGSCL